MSRFKKFIKKPFSLAIIFIILIMLAYGFFSYFIEDLKILRKLRPVRDVLLFPFMLITENIRKIYCQLAEFGWLDYTRCVQTTGPGLNMPEGPPSWFYNVSVLVAYVILIIYYTAIFYFAQRIYYKWK